MKLYFYGTNRLGRREETGGGIIAFAIPDIGFLFRSAHEGNALECEYGALSMLCQFVEANADLFKGQKLEFLGDSTTVVYQVSQLGASVGAASQSFRNLPVGAIPTNGTPEGFLERVLAFKKKSDFSILWIPPAENRAADGVELHPTVKNPRFSRKLNTLLLETGKPKKIRRPDLLPFD